MEVSVAASVALRVVWVSVIITSAWRVLNWVWLRPKKLERCLRQQGLAGNSYRLLIGDTKESSMMLKEAKSKPMDLSHDLAPRVLPFVHQSMNTNGKNSFIWIGPTPRVNISNPEDVKDIFAKYEDFQKPVKNPLVKLLATGLANYEGEKWAKHRKIINPAFHSEKLKRMLPAFHQSCSELIEEWESLASKEGSCELDVWHYLQNLTADVISRTAFGSSYEEGRKIFQLLKDQAQLTIKAIQSVYIPGWRFLPTRMNKRMKEIDKEIKGSLMGIINKREEAIRVGEATKDDLLGILMDSNLKEIRENGNTKNVGMSIEDVIEECKLFYFAGQETTSVLLVWTLVLLSQNQDWQSRARDEVLQVFGSNKPDFDGLSHLKVVTMILLEVLRLYPAVVVLARAIHKNTQLGKLSLPAGVEVSLNTLLVHHDKEFWGEDANEFKPERFSSGVSKATENKFAYFPFGGGPRICIGQNFAMVEAKLALALILQHFAFELSPSYAHAPSAMSSMVLAILCVGLITLGWKVVNWVWLKPKKLERYLRQQGLSGNSYRLLIGDLTENSRMTKEALSKPMEFSHDIVPYVLPLLQETFNKYGKMSFIWLGPVPSVVIFDAELMRETLTKYRVFEKPHSNPLLSFLLTGLLSYEGDKWVKHRRIINPAFHIDKMKDMLPAFHAASENMLSKWEMRFSSTETCELDVWPYLCAFSGDAISRAAFGSNFEEGERFFKLQKEQGALTSEVLNSVHIPLLRFLPTKMNRSMKQISNEMAICLRGIIKKREKAMRAGEATEDDLLGILLKSNFSEIQEHGDDKDVGMSIEEVIEECKVFYLAGEHTTKDLINWTLVLLGKHQDWQRRAREEVVQIFKNNKPDYAGLNRLKIVDMILYEVLRLYPPAIFTTREITKETKLGDISLPPGVQLAVPILFVHHDKEIWGDDVHEFKPERFSEGISKASKNEVAPFFSFSTGPRTCIGQNFALMEAKTVITMILQRFTFELSPAYRHSPFNMLTLEPQYGTQIIFHKI